MIPGRCFRWRHLQKPDEILAARMEKTIRPGSSESSGQHMEFEQVEEIFARDGSGSFFIAFA
jgi:hypothetical protein